LEKIQTVGRRLGPKAHFSDDLARIFLNAQLCSFVPLALMRLEVLSISMEI